MKLDQSVENVYFGLNFAQAQPLQIHCLAFDKTLMLQENNEGNTSLPGITFSSLSTGDKSTISLELDEISPNIEYLAFVSSCPRELASTLYLIKKSSSRIYYKSEDSTVDLQVDFDKVEFCNHSDFLKIKTFLHGVLVRDDRGWSLDLRKELFPDVFVVDIICDSLAEMYRDTLKNEANATKDVCFDNPEYPLGSIDLRITECLVSLNTFIGGTLKLTGGKDLVAKDIGGTSDPYVRITPTNCDLHPSKRPSRIKGSNLASLSSLSISPRTSLQNFNINQGAAEGVEVTKVVIKDLNPVWNHELEIHKWGSQPQSSMHFEVWDQDRLTKDDFMGYCVLDYNILKQYAGSPTNFKLELLANKREKVSGYLEFASDVRFKESEFLFKIGEKFESKTIIARHHIPFETFCTLTIHDLQEAEFISLYQVKNNMKIFLSKARLPLKKIEEASHQETIVKTVLKFETIQGTLALKFAKAGSQALTKSRLKRLCERPRKPRSFI